MNWISLCKLAEIAKDINTVYTAKRACIDDVDISEDLLSIELVKTIREVLLTQRENEEITKERDGFHLSVQAYKATGTLERKHGDIAIVVSDNDRRVVGTGFYEAKLVMQLLGYMTLEILLTTKATGTKQSFIQLLFRIFALSASFLSTTKSDHIQRAAQIRFLIEQ